MRVFLTGGTGFIGGEVARRLRDRGHEVVALVRSPAKAATLRDLGCEIAPGDLSEVDRIMAAMNGAGGVVHDAALYEVGIPPARRPAMYEANVAGAENVLRAAFDLGIPRVVHVSTVNVFGNTHGSVVDESVGRVDPAYLSYYDETKYLAHQVAVGLAAQGLPCAIAQPGQVYGPGDHSGIGETLRRLVRHRLPAVPFPDLGMSFVYRDDAAEGIVRCLERGRAGESYVLGGQIATMREALATLAGLLGRRPPRLSVPTWAIRMAAPLGPVLGRAMGFPVNLREVVSAADGVTYWASDAKARAELGYAPRPLEVGLRDLLAAEGVPTAR